MKTALKLIGLLILGLYAGWASAQAGVITGQTVNQYGVPQPNSLVRVCSVTSTGSTCTPVATIYYDYNLTMVAPNPYTSDNYGNYTFYVPALAAPNMYIVQLTPTNGVTWSYVYNGPYCSLSGCTFSGPITATYFNATTSPYYEVNGTQLASTNLLDTGNIAYKNASNMFTGTVQTAPTWNATTGFTVNGVALACANLSDCANLAKINASNTFTGATNTFNAVVGTTINATAGFQYNGAAASNHVLLGNGADYVDSATIPYSVIATGGGGPFAGVGVPYATSTTASTVATSAQLVAALNTSPSTRLSASLLPLVGTAGTYSYPTSVTTDAEGRVTAITGGTSTTANLDFTVASCAVPSGATQYCTATISFSATSPVVPTQPDANYTVECTPDMLVTLGTSYSFNVEGRSTTGFVYALGNAVNATGSAQAGTIMCHLHHS